MRARALVALAALALAGCEIDPYCLGCGGGELDAGPSDAGPDASVVRRDGAVDSAMCVPSGDAELCDGADQDCDGRTDEGFDLQNDPTNCGACGEACRFENAEGRCVEGRCELVSCFDGFVDLDGAPGCEYACPVFPIQGEDCNGFDDDCDGEVDEPAELPPAPSDLCRTTPGTPCEGVVPTCATREGRTTWFCNYPATVEFDPAVPNGIALEEARCDGQDGDCDGLRDESFVGLGNECDNGARGACRDVGRIACDPADGSRTFCDLLVLPDPAPTAPSAEVCNGVDDDCDGVVDNSDPSDPGRVRDDMVRIARGAFDFWIYRHEASRPDSTSGAGGTSTARACGRGGVLPWTSVGYDEAARACAAAGHRLCTAAEWQAACEGESARRYPYGASYGGDVCNGADHGAALLPAGAMAMCESEEGVLDLSGNAKEWTADRRGTSLGGSAIYVVRGGSHESPEFGLTCATDLSRATEDTLLPTIGFRCCSDAGP